MAVKILQSAFTGSDDPFRGGETRSGPEGWSYYEHTHIEYNEFVCCLEGKLTQVVNGDAIEQTPGVLVFIRAQDRHRLEGRNFCMVNLMFPSYWLERLEAYWGSRRAAEFLFRSPQAPVARLGAGELAEFRPRLERLLSQFHGRYAALNFSRFLANTLLDYFLPREQLENIPENYPEWLRKTLVWLEENRHRPLRVADVVEQSCRTPEHVSRAFRQFLGETPSSYLRLRHLRRAAELLANTNLPIMEICYQTGFENPGYFFRSFRAEHGLTPLAYRKQNRTSYS